MPKPLNVSLIPTVVRPVTLTALTDVKRASTKEIVAPFSKLIGSLSKTAIRSMPMI
ncbi:hypothetical protein D3C84_1147890 [compost metagenome]